MCSYLREAATHAQRFWPDFHGVELVGFLFYYLICYDKPESLDFLCLSFHMCHMGEKVSAHSVLMVVMRVKASIWGRV